ncbi:MAG: hypothetical protein ACSHXF_01350 [Aquaticitalea sp.]
MNAFLSILCLVLVACNSKNDKSEERISTKSIEKSTEDTISYTKNTTEPKTQKTNMATFSYNDQALLSLTDFECKVFIYEATLVVQLLNSIDAINISLGGIHLYEQKPYRGDFTIQPDANMNTAVAAIHANNPESGEKIKAPMFFGGKTTITKFNADEIQIEIDALGGFYSDTENPANWKPIKGKIVVKTPQFNELDVKLKNYFY